MGGGNTEWRRPAEGKARDRCGLSQPSHAALENNDHAVNRQKVGGNRYLYTRSEFVFMFDVHETTARIR